MSIYKQVLGFIERLDPDAFEALALEVYRYQFQSVAAYRDFCQTLRITPERVRSLEEVPAVSTVAFKHALLEDANEASGAQARTFFTSGTTTGCETRGRHLVPHPEVYRRSALAHLRRMLFPDGLKLRVLALHPTADRLPDSSLAQMISWCIEEFGRDPSICVADGCGVDLGAATRFLADADGACAPVCLLGTTASFGALFQWLEAKSLGFKLACGSRLMDTGGAKGQTAPLDADAVCERAERLLGIRPALAINEYGMTELCSQLYDATAFNSEGGGLPAGERVKIAPPWLRPVAVDPATLKPLREGEIGMLRFFDLANVGSVAAVLTEDYGLVKGQCVRVLGRASAAEARGCALAMDQFKTAELRRPDGFESGRPRMSFSVEAQGEAESGRPAVSPSDIRSTVARLRRSLPESPEPNRTPRALAATFERWRDRGFARRAAAVSKIASSSGMSKELLDESIDALLRPFDAEALAAFADKAAARAVIGGFVMPANIPGAGLHELVCALISGAAALVKTSSREPFFLDGFVRTLRETDPAIGARVEVISFGRERIDLVAALRAECDFIVVLGDDPALTAFHGAARLFGFGSRASGAFISGEALRESDREALAESLARDVTLFEQQGCLSPHHLFVEDQLAAEARAFARSIADALDGLARRLPPCRLPFHAAAAIRHVRESARWRKLGGHEVELIEGLGMRWTVIVDPDARFSLSPGYRTVFITPVRDRVDLEARLAPSTGRLEAFALAAPRPAWEEWSQLFAALGISYVCAPGMLQSPPLSWRHGGGAFLDFLSGA